MIVINEALKPDGGDQTNYWMFYTGNGTSYPTYDQVKKFGKDHGCTIIWWGSDEARGYKGIYNGDTICVAKDVDKLPSGYKEDAKKYGQALKESIDNSKESKIRSIIKSYGEYKDSFIDDVIKVINKPNRSLLDTAKDLRSLGLDAYQVNHDIIPVLKESLDEALISLKKDTVFTNNKTGQWYKVIEVQKDGRVKVKDLDGNGYSYLYVNKLTNKDYSVEESLNEEYYGVFRKGDSIGMNDSDDYSCRDGLLIKVFTSADEAKDYAKKARKNLTSTDREYYRMGYTSRKLTDKECNDSSVKKMMKESLSSSDFKPNSRSGNGIKVKIKKSGKLGYVNDVVDDKWSKGIKVIYEDRPGMYPEFFKFDEVDIVDESVSLNEYMIVILTRAEQMAIKAAVGSDAKAGIAEANDVIKAVNDASRTGLINFSKSDLEFLQYWNDLLIKYPNSPKAKYMDPDLKSALGKIFK